jgi:hypothetical protein
MLSIRVIRDGGYEFVRGGISVVKLQPTEPKRVSYWLVGQNECVEDILDGIIYVMNENGKTVATYSLYPEPIKVG